MPMVLILCDSVLDLHKTGNWPSVASFIFITPPLIYSECSVIILSLPRFREIKLSVKLANSVLVPEPREKEWVCGYVYIKKKTLKIIII